MLRHAALACVAAALAGCASGIAVTQAGSGVVLAPRPADCNVEFYRTKPPERAYDEVATLHFDGTNVASAAGAQEMMRKRACELGADAVVVTRDFIPGTRSTRSAMTGTAVSYPDARRQHRLDAVLRKAEEERAAAERGSPQGADARARAAAFVADASGASPPAGFVKARMKQPAIAHATADRRAREVGDLGAGVDVWVAGKPSSGWRRIWMPGVPAAWVEDDLVDLRAPAPPGPAPAVEPATPPADGGAKVRAAPFDV